DFHVTGVQTCALPIYAQARHRRQPVPADCPPSAGRRSTCFHRCSLPRHHAPASSRQCRAPPCGGGQAGQPLHFWWRVKSGKLIERIAVNFPALKNDVFLRALMRQPVPYTPLSMMHQAGRYLPEYNETRARAGSFMALAQTREYACAFTSRPLLRFELAAAILFSDILTVPHAMGLGLDFVAGEGPRFAHPVRH